MSNKEVQLNRLNISKRDLLQAREFAEYILKKGLHGKKSEESKLIHLAFNTSLIVSYSRPFSHNYDVQGKRESSLLSSRDNKELNEDEAKLHEQVINSRNTEYHIRMDRRTRWNSSVSKTCLPRIVEILLCNC